MNAHPHPFPLQQRPRRGESPEFNTDLDTGEPTTAAPRDTRDTGQPPASRRGRVGDRDAASAFRVPDTPTSDGSSGVDPPAPPARFNKLFTVPPVLADLTAKHAECQADRNPPPDLHLPTRKESSVRNSGVHLNRDFLPPSGLILIEPDLKVRRGVA